MSFAHVLLALSLLAGRQAPPGALLHIRLTAPIGSYASRTGDPVSAVLIAPLISGGETILPAGSLVSGRLRSVQRVGLGFIHELAALDVEFTEVASPNGEPVPLSARLQEVDNARERLTPAGSIRGERPTGSLSYRAGGYIRAAVLWDVHARVAIWAVKTLLLQVPEPELYYPAGVELTLALTEPMMALPAGREAPPQLLTGDERTQLTTQLAEMPFRTYSPDSNRPSDLINIMFVGSHADLASAFVAAGWNEPHQTTLRTNIQRIRAVADGRGDRSSPMSQLLLDGAKADMSWQKGFNDVAKRHHIRIWKQTTTWNGREIWVGAATRDVDFAYWRPGSAMTHKIAENVDEERDKVVNDLVFASCVDGVDDLERLDVPTVARNGSGDAMRTDAHIAVVQLSACQAPPSSRSAEGPTLPRHGGKIQRFVRREILSIRSDLLRDNLYWRSYEGLRWVITAYRQRGERAREIDVRPQPSEGKQSTNRASFVTDMFR